MTETKEYIQSKVSSRLNANNSRVEAKNNRYHYYFTFDESIGWTWVYSQVMEADAELKTDIELWEIHFPDSELEVREVNRRANIDPSQHGLSEF